MRVCSTCFLVNSKPQPPALPMVIDYILLALVLTYLLLVPLCKTGYILLGTIGSNFRDPRGAESPPPGARERGCSFFLRRVSAFSRVVIIRFPGLLFCCMTEAAGNSFFSALVSLSHAFICTRLNLLIFFSFVRY